LGNYQDAARVVGVGRVQVLLIVDKRAIPVYIGVEA
jgi:hypothetical protein